MGSTVPKPLMRVAGLSLLERCIRLYEGCGFSDFVVLVGQASEQVADHLAEIGLISRVSLHKVPPAETGRGIALASAIGAGVVDLGRRGVLVYPDDLFTDQLMPAKVLGEHIEAVRSKDVYASTVLVQGRSWPFGVAEIDERCTVTEFREKPFIHQLTAVGTHVFEPEAYKLTSDLAKKRKQLELEREVVPMLASSRRLHAVLVPSHTWLPINTLKDFDDAELVFSQAITA